MSDWLERFNRLQDDEAVSVLLQCCDSRAWANALAGRRPFANDDELLDAADAIWWTLPAQEWLHAFAAHPRIGERKAAHAQHGQGDSWSAREQEGAMTSAAATRTALADMNQAYEDRFGFTYIVCATGKSGDEMLRIAETRLQNDPETELRNAAAEQAKITRLRLQLLSDDRSK